MIVHTKQKLSLRKRLKKNLLGRQWKKILYMTSMMGDRK